MREAGQALGVVLAVLIGGLGAIYAWLAVQSKEPRLIRLTLISKAVARFAVGALVLAASLSPRTMYALVAAVLVSLAVEWGLSTVARRKYPDGGDDASTEAA